MKIKEALSQAKNRLFSISSTAALDAEVILAYILNKDRSFLYAYPDSVLSSQQDLHFQSLISQRHSGMPVAYITGKREFWSLSLTVNTSTLIPRPETELLVEIALNLLSDNRSARVLDLGTGSGAIALACAKECPHWEITASDISPLALEVAKENAKMLNLDHIKFYESDWLKEIPNDEPFDAILSNPPYIAANDPHVNNLGFEPRLALISEKNGLAALEYIVSQSITQLKPRGVLLLEHGFDQKAAVASFLKKYKYTEISCWHDGNGHARVSGGKL